MSKKNQTPRNPRLIKFQEALLVKAKMIRKKIKIRVPLNLRTNKELPTPSTKTAS